MESLLRDLRLAARSLLKTPGFTVAALLCLALGMGASTAIFSIVDTVLLKPLPYAEPDRVLMIWNQFLLRDAPKAPASGREFLDLREQSSAFAEVAALGPQLVNLTGMEEPEQLVAARASAGIFPVLGIEAARGRVFTPEEDRFGHNTVAVLGHRLWEQRFGADPGIVGRTLSLDGKPYVVIGVLPPEIDGFGGFEFDLWLPQGLNLEKLPPRSVRVLSVVGRLKPGTTLDQAQAEMDVVAKRFQQEYPEEYPEESGWGIRLVPVHEDLVGDVRGILIVLLVSVSLVLLIACANVANLLLVRATTRQKEVAIRLALGSSRAGLIRQFLSEGVLLALAGAGLGLLLAYGATRALVVANPGNIPRIAEVAVDRQVLFFALALALLTGICFGLVPAFSNSGRDLRETLADGGKTSASGAAGHRTRGTLVVAEIALALAVLIGAGLMLTSFRRLLAVDPGFRPDNLLTLQLSLPRSRYAEDPQLLAFYRQILEQVGRIPGVEGAAVASQLPIGGLDLTGDIVVEGRGVEANEAPPTTGWRMVSPGYFRTMGIPLLTGRDFTAADSEQGAGAVIVDESLAERLWPGQSPLGKRLQLKAPTPELSDWRTVVGVAGHVRHRGLAEAGGDQLYVPIPQFPVRILHIALRTAGAPEGSVQAVRRAVWAIDRDLPVLEVRTMRQRLHDSLAQPRLSASLFGSFAASALTLTVLGVYGVMAYSVAQRTRDMGIRMALGAAKGDVVRLVLRQGTLLIAAGLALGLFAAWGLSRAMQSLLYGVEATDPLIFAGVSLLLIGLALAATYLPARRASRVDPVVALRYE